MTMLFKLTCLKAVLSPFYAVSDRYCFVAPGDFRRQINGLLPESGRSGFRNRIKTAETGVSPIESP
jgi:hypothetical protein